MCSMQSTGDIWKRRGECQPGQAAMAKRLEEETKVL